jgi:hypothetical protein
MGGHRRNDPRGAHTCTLRARHQSLLHMRVRYDRAFTDVRADNHSGMNRVEPHRSAGIRGH